MSASYLSVRAAQNTLSAARNHDPDQQRARPEKSLHDDERRP